MNSPISFNWHTPSDELEPLSLLPPESLIFDAYGSHVPMMHNPLDSALGKRSYDRSVSSPDNASGSSHGDSVACTTCYSPVADENVKRRKILDHKAELARLARSRKKNRLEFLEKENADLRQELINCQKSIHELTTVLSSGTLNGKLDGLFKSDYAFKAFAEALATNPSKRAIFSQFIGDVHFQ